MHCIKNDDFNFDFLLWAFFHQNSIFNYLYFDFRRFYSINMHCFYFTSTACVHEFHIFRRVWWKIVLYFDFWIIFVIANINRSGSKLKLRKQNRKCKCSILHTLSLLISSEPLFIIAFMGKIECNLFDKLVLWANPSGKSMGSTKISQCWKVKSRPKNQHPYYFITTSVIKCFSKISSANSFHHEIHTFWDV